MIRAARRAFLRLRRRCALDEIRQAARAGIRDTATMRAYALRVEQYEQELDRLATVPAIACGAIDCRPTSPMGSEAAWVDSGSAMPSGAPRTPRRSLVDSTETVFRTIVVALAIMLVAMLVWNLSPHVAATLWNA